MSARPDLAVRHRDEVLAERRAEGFEDLLRRIQRNAADEMKLTGHVVSFMDAI
jgi:hypothetical protein